MESRVDLGLGQELELVRAIIDLGDDGERHEELERELVVGARSHRGLDVGLELEEDLLAHFELLEGTLLIGMRLDMLPCSMEVLL